MFCAWGSWAGFVHLKKQRILARFDYSPPNIQKKKNEHCESPKKKMGGKKRTKNAEHTLRRVLLYCGVFLCVVWLSHESLLMKGAMWLGFWISIKMILKNSGSLFPPLFFFFVWRYMLYMLYTLRESLFGE